MRSSRGKAPLRTTEMGSRRLKLCRSLQDSELKL